MKTAVSDQQSATLAFNREQGARRDPGRRNPDVACLGRNPLLAVGDIGRPTSDYETVNSEP
jgi:hypothetical protein